jgi:hypothetical protein
MTPKEKAVNDYIKAKHNQDECIGFIDGYTQCQEDNKDKKYTYEDMRRAFFNGNVMRDIDEFNCFLTTI